MVVHVTMVVLHLLLLLLLGNNYYCESGTYSSSSYILYADDPLWDGQNYNGHESTCCTIPNMPWFLKTLNETTTDNIELRVCIIIVIMAT